ncbi:hypothetical protein PC129_g21448 [Phytophthora cactorum]|uniref:Apple domain-containing protein n=1 Tax=Phytophthora cactorum TaxID=29920 RepID=A0A8T1H5X9_9STRA|nr:hypothetical protein PC129_g21448 [Phytophthora cactorum]
MAGRKLATAAGFAGIITAGLVSADVPIVVYHDATYSLPEAYGVPCSGVGAEPEGTACPKAGHVATSDCQPYLVSYNGAVCVAPVDAECVLGHDDVWGCEFPKTGYSSAVEAETIVAYVGETLGWGTGYKKNHGTTEDNADKTEDQQTSENHDTEGQPYDETTQTRKMAEDPYAQTDAPTESTTFAPTDETTDAPTQDPYAQTDAPTESTTFAPTDDPTDAPTDGPTDAPTEPPTPCDNQGINGIGVENKVRYNNADIYSTTPGPRNSQSWHSCCRSCYNDLNCYAFSFQQTSSDSVCELTTSTSGREEDQQNWQAGNMGRAS